MGQQQGWLKAVGPLLAIFGGAFAFLGLVAVLLSVLGVFLHQSCMGYRA